MTTTLKIMVGGSIKEDLAAFRSAWERADRGEHVDEDRVLSFGSWEGLAAVLTSERVRLLRHLHETPEPSVSALARSLGRQFRRVHADIAALEGAGLVARSAGWVRATTDTIQAEIRL